MLFVRKHNFLSTLLVLGLWSWCSADIFSATYKMEHLLETRQRVIEGLDAYIHKEEDRLRDLKLYLNLYKREQDIAMKDGSKYVGNPINAFVLIKRLTADLDDIERRINQTTEYASIRNMRVDGNNATILYPTTVDLEGAGIGMRRLQKTYRMKVEDLSDGVLNGAFSRGSTRISTGQPLSSHDCYKLGTIIFKKKDFKNTLAWQMEALRKFKLEDDTIPRPITIINILEYIGICHYRMGDPELAARWTMKILKLDPTNVRARKNIVAYDQTIMKNENPALQDKNQGDDEDNTNTTYDGDNTGMKNETSSKDAGADDGNDVNTETNIISDVNAEADEANEYNVIKIKENAKVEMVSNTEDSNENDENSSKPTDKVTTSEPAKTDKNETLVTESTTLNKTNSEIGNAANNVPNTNSIDTSDNAAKNDTNTNSTDTSDNAANNVTNTNSTDTSDNAANNVTNTNSTDTSDNAANNVTNTNSTDTSDEEMEYSYVDYMKTIFDYEASCRGDSEIAPEISYRLSCSYLNDKPFLKLAPIKMEQLYINPDAFIFYDVLTDGEMEHIISSAKRSIKRSRVGDSASQAITADYRISQNTWLLGNESLVMERVTQRIGDFTGLSMKYAEDIQIANYGLGGQYEPHLDISMNQESAESKRIATVMFYMSDVPQGGATVFPKLGLSVFPVKGAAVFWFNMFPSGNANPNSLHAGCPVLEGSKWVANKWIRINGQEFLRYCNLDYEKDEDLNCPEPVVKSDLIDL